MHALQTVESASRPTFTDAVLGYLRDIDVDPRGAGVVLAVAGPPVGDVISIARSRWTLSRSGLARMFMGHAHILNDVAATAWSLLESKRPSLEIVSGAAPNFDTDGRWIVVTLDEGVGAAIISVERGMVRIGSCETGHIGFSPFDSAEVAAMEEMRRLQSHVSWETMLCRSPQLNADSGRWASAAGAFVGDAMLATGCWAGAIVSGSQIGKLRSPDLLASFNMRLRDKSKYGRHLSSAAISLLFRRDPLAGCLQALLAGALTGGHPSPTSSSDRSVS